MRHKCKSSEHAKSIELANHIGEHTGTRGQKAPELSTGRIDNESLALQ